MRNILIITASLWMFASGPAMSNDTEAGEKKFIEAVEGELENPAPAGTADSDSQKLKKVLIRKKQVVPEAALEPPSAGNEEIDPNAGRGLRRRVIVPDRQYGQYKLRLAALKPTFDGDVDFYKDLYGKSKWHPDIMLDWIPWDGPIGLGFGMRFGYYSDDGYGVRGEPGPGGELEVDKNQETRFRLYPIQAVVVAQFTPFTEKWVGVDAWVGYEHLMYTETRLSGSDTPSNKLYVNTGTNKNYVYGGAVNFCINILDEHSIAVLRRGMGIGYVYISYIYEVVRPLSDDSSDVDLSRTSQGFALSFESAL